MSFHEESSTDESHRELCANLVPEMHFVFDQPKCLHAISKDEVCVTTHTTSGCENEGHEVGDDTNGFRVVEGRVRTQLALSGARDGGVDASFGGQLAQGSATCDFQPSDLFRVVLPQKIKIWFGFCQWGSVNMNFDFLFCGPSDRGNIAHENRGNHNVKDRSRVVDLPWGSDDVKLCSALVDFLFDLQSVYPLERIKQVISDMGVSGSANALIG